MRREGSARDALSKLIAGKMSFKKKVSGKHVSLQRGN